MLDVALLSSKLTASVVLLNHTEVVRVCVPDIRCCEVAERDTKHGEIFQ